MLRGYLPLFSATTHTSHGLLSPFVHPQHSAALVEGRVALTHAHKLASTAV